MTSNVETLSMSWCHMPQMNKGHVLMKVTVMNAWLYSAHMNITSQFFYNHIGKMATWAYASQWLLDIWEFIQWDPNLYAEGISSQIWAKSLLYHSSKSQNCTLIGHFSQMNSSDWLCADIVEVWQKSSNTTLESSCHTFHIWLPLAHWGRVTHICISKLTTIGSDRHQAIHYLKQCWDIVNSNLRNKF